jgi:hypothetical protein
MKGLISLGFCNFVVRPLALMAVMSSPSVAQAPSGPSFNVLMWQNDYGRTGMNLQEQNLAYPLGGFGQLCHANLDGQVYAQPLEVTNVQVTANGSSHHYNSVVYVVTQWGTLHAIDGTPPSGTHGSQTICNIIPMRATGEALGLTIPQ